MTSFLYLHFFISSTSCFRMVKQLCSGLSTLHALKCAAAIQEHVNRIWMVFRCPLAVGEIHFKGGLPLPGRHSACVHEHVCRAVGAGFSVGWGAVGG